MVNIYVIIEYYVAFELHKDFFKLHFTITQPINMITYNQIQIILKTYSNKFKLFNFLEFLYMYINFIVIEPSVHMNYVNKYKYNALKTYGMTYFYY